MRSTLLEGGRSRRSAGFVIAILMLLLTFSGAALAQFEKGSIGGTVTDASGAVVVGAAITVTDTGTNAVRTTTTDSAGGYTVTNLPPAVYEVKASAKGFGDISQKIQVSPGVRGSLDIQLKAAGTETTVEVVSAAETQVDTESSSLTQVVDTKRVAQLPSLTRDPYDFVQTLGNVNQDSSSGTGGKDEITRGAGVSVNGQRSAGVDILLDGGENVDLYTTKVGQSVPLDAVEQFTVTSSNFTAEYGRASGGVINVVTKSGTNAFHGSLYEFNRVSALTSNDYDDNSKGIPKAKYTRNQFGYSVGGPIIKNKLFFFSSTEWQRVRSQANVTTAVMDPAFLAASNANTQAFFVNQTLRPGFTVTQVLTANDASITPTANTPLLAAYGTNNPIFDVGSYPVPSDSGGGAPQNNYNTTNRVDFQLSDKTTMFGRYTLFNQNEFAGFINNSPYAGFDTGQTNFNNNAMFSLTHVWSPRLVSDTKLLFNRLNVNQPLASTQPVQPTLYFSASSAVSVLGNLISLPGYVQTAPGLAIPFGGPQNVTEISHSFSWTKNKHELHFGGEYLYTRDNRTFGAYENAVEALNASGLANNLERLLGGQAGWFQVVIDPQGKFPCVKDQSGNTVVTPDCSINLPAAQPSFSRSNRYNDMAFYAQDNWKVTPRLTLNLGLRWEYYGVQHNKDASLDSNFVYGPGSTFFDQIRNGQVFTVDATANSPASPVGGLWKPQYHNFGPRVGFALDVFGDGKTSLRGGYGIAYERNFGNVTFNVIQNPPGQFNSIFSPAGPITTNNLGPFAGTSGTKSLPPPSLRYVRQDLPTAYTQMWNLSLQRQVLGHSLLALEYSGAHGIHLYSIENVNQAGFGVVYEGTDPTVNPFDRLNEQYGNMNTRGANGFSYYNALNTRFVSTNLFHQGLDITVNYTWSHSIDNLSSTFSETPQTENLGLLDPFQPALDKGSADFDARHRIALSAVWTLPYAKGTHGIAKQVLDGWELAPIITAHTGNPFTVFDSNGFTGLDTVVGRYIPSGPIQLSGSTNTLATGGFAGPNTFNYISLPAPNTYVDPLVGSGELPTCDMTTNAAGNLISTGQNCHWPSNMTGRNAFRGPGWYNINMSIAKYFPINERFKLQFRSEFYNLLNHSNYYVQPGGTQDAGNYGEVPFQVIGKRGVVPAAGVPNERRFIQMALRLTF
ncbi:MAG TPA: carboxypeptidase regulatory-like domain-containing protein [Terriglobales bacterium]|nr:carboxypeptidase regulatory-like domain-containing protein [Terriglobales bacterium]